MKTINQNTTLNYEQAGSGPAIVFIHDNTENPVIATSLFKSLTTSGFRVIVTNLRGLSHLDEATVDDHSNDTIALFNHLGIGRAVVFGVGRGSCILLNLLEKHPGRIAGSSMVIPQEMAESLHRFSGRDGLLKTLQEESAAPLIRELFKSVPSTSSKMAEIPALRKWLTRVGKIRQRHEASGLSLLADLHLPLLMVDTPTTVARRRWRQRLGGRLRAFNGSLLALLDLLVLGESEEFDDEFLGESH